jgi:hypothetical protein
MTSCYFVNHVNLIGRESTIVAEIEKINPDILIGLCLEEYDYHYLFGNFLEVIQPYLLRTGKKMKLIAPYVDTRPVPDNIIVEDSYGYYHWSTGPIDNAIDNDIKFKFTDDVKLFTNYNNNAKYQRAMLVDQFVKNDLLKDGIVTLIQPEMRMPNGNLYEYKYHTGAKLVDELHFVLNSEENYGAGRLPKSYLKGVIDIVSESTYDSGQYFITEKTTKPLAVLKPFLVFGPPFIHKFLYDKFQIEYYTELFDYSFDEEHDVPKRINGIVENLLRLSQLSKTELLSIYESINHKLIKNRKNYIDVKNEGRYIPQSLEFLKNTDIKWYGDVDAGILGLISMEMKK